MQYLPVIISTAALLLSAYLAASRSNKETTAELTKVIVKLESIEGSLRDLKSDISALSQNQKEDHDRLVRVEQSLKTAWKQIDTLKGGAPYEPGEF